MNAVNTLPLAPHPEDRWQRFMMRGVRTALFGVVIAVCLWVLQAQRFVPTLIYSLCISLSCWLLIDSTRLGVARFLHRAQPGDPATQSRWPGWPWMAAIIVAGGLLGYTIGNEIANAITGYDTPGLFTASWSNLATVVVLALLPAMVITEFFKSREIIASQRARVLRAERHATEQQLQLLQAQLEPHMLFNTLANLRALIALDPERAQAMLDRLIAFLRASLAGSRTGSHSLAAEFERLRDYLELMQVRMGTRLATRFELPAELADTEVPAMLLQPIVENSIKHGLEPRREGGRIEVSAARDGGALVLRVRDTGIGLKAVETPSPGGGFGLLHVRERLATLYGAANASFRLDAADDADGGTCAVVRMPLNPPGAPTP